MRVNHREDELEGHDIGLENDLPRLLQRRGLLQLAAGAGLATLAGCATAEVTSSGATPSSTAASAAPSASASSTASATPSATGTTTASAEVPDGEIPEETAGPFPGDGSNGANVLTESGIVRSDITSSFGSSDTTAGGVPLEITMTIFNYDKDSEPYAGAAVYLWHCDREGRYSLYSSGVEDENYLRGVQEADENGQVRFTSIYPACYDGRWPHIHFEVYPSLAKATDSDNKIATSQMALTEDSAEAVYATEGYEQSVRNLSQVSLETDGVFRDGYDLQIPEFTGSASKGYALTFSCAV